MRLGPRGAALLAAVTALLGGAASLLPPAVALEESVGLRWLYAIRGPLPAPDTVAVVGISRDSAEAFGLPPELDEWPRKLHARLIDALAARGASAIVFDVIFEETRASEEDVPFRHAIERAGNVILLERVTSEHVPSAGSGTIMEKRTRPIALLKQAALGSAPFVLPTVPFLTSQFWTFGRGAGDTPTLPSVALQAHLLRHYDWLREQLVMRRPQLAAEIAADETLVRKRSSLEATVRKIRGAFRNDPGLAPELLAAAGEATSAAARERRALIALYAGPDHRYLNYYGPPMTIRTLPYHELLLRSSSIDDAAVRGRVVFVGYSEDRQAEQQDWFLSCDSDRSGRNLSGVEIGATAFANLLEGSSVAPLGIGWQLLLLAAFGAVAAAALTLLPTVAGFAAALLAAGGYFTLAVWQFQVEGLWLPLVVPLLLQLPFAFVAAVLWKYQAANAQRQRIRTALGYYLPPQAVTRLVEQSLDARSDRQLLHGACLFSDVEQYTAVSEGMDPRELGELLSDYYEVMLEVVDRHGGVVSDIAGDSMVAIWASTEPYASNRRQASRAAVEIVSAVGEFNRRRGGKAMPTGVGLDAGKLLLGHIGAEQRYEYRAVGDIVTTAARLQGLNRILSTRVLASRATLESVDGFVTRDLGAFLLRGKSEPAYVLELLCPSEALDDATAQLAERFAAALRRFHAGDWRQARAAFERILESWPQDGPSRYFRDAADAYCRSAPPRWDGVMKVGVK